MVECNIISNWGEPERAPPSLYNEEISVCLHVRSSDKNLLGSGGKILGAACALHHLHVVLASRNIAVH